MLTNSYKKSVLCLALILLINLVNSQLLATQKETTNQQENRMLSGQNVVSNEVEILEHQLMEEHQWSGSERDLSAANYIHFPTNRWFMLEDQRRGCVYAKGGNGSEVGSAACNKNDAKFQWRFYRYGTGYYIVNRNNFYLEPRTQANANRHFWVTKNRTQPMNFYYIGGNKFLIKATRSNRCLDNTGSANTGKFWTWSCYSSNINQQFYIKDAVTEQFYSPNQNYRPDRNTVTLVQMPFGPGRAYRLQDSGNECVTNRGDDRSVTGEWCNGDSQKHWKFEQVDSREKTYNIIIDSNHYLSLTRNRGQNNYGVISNDRHSRDSIWQVLHLANGQYLIKNVEKDMCIERVTSWWGATDTYKLSSCSFYRAHQVFRLWSKYSSRYFIPPSSTDDCPTYCNYSSCTQWCGAY